MVLILMQRTNKDHFVRTSLSYEFYGPKGTIGDLDAYYSLVRTQRDQGEYRVVATDNLGCSTEHKFYPFGKKSVTEKFLLKRCGFRKLS